MEEKKSESKIVKINRSWLNRRLSYVKKRKSDVNSKYKEIMNVSSESMNKCFMIDCNFGYGSEVHHIQPLSRGGTNNFSNLIILCKVCHNINKLHSKWEEREVELLTLKFYHELEVLGFTSDCSDEEFLKKVAESKAVSHIEDNIQKTAQGY